MKYTSVATVRLHRLKCDDIFFTQHINNIVEGTKKKKTIHKNDKTNRRKNRKKPPLPI